MDLVMEGISARFSGTTVLDDVSPACGASEIHAIVRKTADREHEGLILGLPAADNARLAIRGLGRSLSRGALGRLAGQVGMAGQASRRETRLLSGREADSFPRLRPVRDAGQPMNMRGKRGIQTTGSERTDAPPVASARSRFPHVPANWPTGAGASPASPRIGAESKRGGTP
jgi:hypothetical protein